MSESEPEADGESVVGTGEHAGKRSAEGHECRRCGREQGLVSKYGIWLCRQCFREVSRSMGFKKYS